MILITNPPPTNYILTLIKPFSFVWYVIPLLKTGALASTRNLFVWVDDKKTWKKWGRLDRLQLSATILARWRRLVASNKALNLIYWAMRAVLYQRTAAVIKMASLFGTFFCHHFVCCCPGGRWGNMEQVVARWQWPVASGKSPGHAALGNALHIAQANCHGHWNGQQQQNMLMPLSILSLTITVAKYHVLVIIN